MSIKKLYNILRTVVLVLGIALMVVIDIFLLSLWDLGFLIDLVIIFIVLYSFNTIGLLMIEKYIGKEIDKRYKQFMGSLEINQLDGIKELYQNWLEVSLARKNSKFEYSNLSNVLFYDYLTGGQMELMEQKIEDIIEFYSNEYSIFPLLLLESYAMMLLEDDNVSDTQRILERKLDYIEQCIDQDFIESEETKESILNHSSEVRHMLAFMNEPNENRANRLYRRVKENYSTCYTTFFIVKVLENSNQLEVAKKYLKNIENLSGDFRLLKTLKDTYK